MEIKSIVDSFAPDDKMDKDNLKSIVNDWHKFMFIVFYVRNMLMGQNNHYEGWFLAMIVQQHLQWHKKIGLWSNKHRERDIFPCIYPK